MEMPAAISPYSIAVAPFSSFTKRKIRVGMLPLTQHIAGCTMGKSSCRAANAVEETPAADYVKFSRTFNQAPSSGRSPSAVANNAGTSP
jgi:hypothetical protein